MARLLAGSAPEADLTELIPDVAINEPEQDRLGLLAVADTLVELVSATDTPVNVAVFGAWGSGKTSLARLLENGLQPSSRIRFVYINAWKYSETPLRRHFLAGAGKGLGEAPTFTDRLYSKSRTTRYQFRKRTLGVVLGIAVLTLIVAVVLLALAQLLVWLPDQSQDFFGLLGRAISANAGALLVSTSLLSPLLTFVVNEMKVELNEDEPSSAEQFDKRFGELVEEHMPEGGRIVFFVDELDRARAHQMQEVLETLKTFLDQPGCVFVVAADQVVLEEAISKAEQVTVHTQGNPYYSGGSAYLDKVFQYQIQLPAYEAPALTRFALDLVDERPGVWSILGLDLGNVVSLLVPAHVRSPRRVKVLLNNFVLAARVAISRLGQDAMGVDELKQLAKLVCLRTEFPLFYRDVEAYPALVDAVTAHVVGNVPRIADFAASRDLNRLAIAYASGTAHVDIRLAPAGDASDKADEVASDQLRDYLRRSGEIDVSNHTLIYLRPPGSQLGLEASIARQIELAAKNGDVNGAIASIRGADVETIDKAVQYLLMSLEDAVGVEVGNVARVVLALSKQSAESLSPQRASSVLDVVSRPDVWSRLTPVETEPILALAARLESGERGRRERAVFDRASEGDSWAQSLLQAYPLVGETGVDLAKSLLSNHVISGTAVPMDVMKAAQPETVRGLWVGTPLGTLGDRLADPSVVQPQPVATAQALSAHLEDPERWLLLGPAIRTGNEQRIKQLQSLIDTLRPARSASDAQVVLDALTVAPQLLSALSKLLPEDAISVSPAVLLQALASLIVHSGSSDESLKLVRDGSRSLKGVLEGTEFGEDDMASALGDSWDEDWSSDADTTQRIRQHAVIASLATAAPSRGTAWADVIARSILGILSAETLSQRGRAEVVSRIANWGPARPSRPRLVELFNGLASPRTVSAADAFTNIVRQYCLFLVASLLEKLDDEQRDVLQTQLPPSGAPGSMAAVCIALYVAVVAPKWEDESEVILAAARLAGDDVSGPRARPFFESLREPTILKMLVAMHDSNRRAPERLVGWLRQNGEEVSWARQFAQTLRSGSTVAERKITWEFIASLRLRSKKAVAIVLDAALDEMIDTAGSLNDLLAELPDAFPDWEPNQKTLKIIQKAEVKFAGNTWRKRARQGLDRLQRK